MALADIQNKIQADANEKIEALQAQTEREVAAIEADTKAQKQALEATFKQEIIDAKVQQKAQTESKAKREKKQLIEAKRRMALDEVFDAARQELTAVSEREYTELLQALNKRLPQDLQAARIYTPTGKSAITKETLNLQGEYVEDDSMQAGLRIEGDTFAYDLSLETLLSDIRDQAEVEVAKTLFG